MALRYRQVICGEGGARRKGAVEDAGQEEGGEDEEEGSDLVSAGAERRVVGRERPAFVAYASHFCGDAEVAGKVLRVCALFRG